MGSTVSPQIAKRAKAMRAESFKETRKVRIEDLVLQERRRLFSADPDISPEALESLLRGVMNAGLRPYHPTVSKALQSPQKAGEAAKHQDVRKQIKKRMQGRR